MGRNKNKNKQQRMKKKNEKLLTALMPTSTAASTQASAAAAATITTTTTAGNAIDNDNETADTTTTLACYHGSDEGHFAKASDYQIMVFDEWISVLEKQGTAEYPILQRHFTAKHIHLLKSSDFYRYTFSYATERFRKSYRTEKYSPFLKQNLQQILRLAIDSKYWYCSLSVDREKHRKYSRDIETDRGIINLLHRETSPFCHCMKPYKIEANGMRKTGKCHGCKKEFPKEMKRCNRCDHVPYCSTKCQKNDWPRHKQFCTPHHKSEA